MVDIQLSIQPFNKALHNRRAFSSGVAPMDKWLRESAADQIRLNRLRLWCAVNAQKSFVGYYALAMHSVAPGEAPALSRRNERHEIPAIYLSALAVSEAHQNHGIGRALLGDAIIRSVALSEEIGATAIILDVLKDDNFERRQAFYLHLGFVEIGNNDPGRIFLSIKDARTELSR